MRPQESGAALLLASDELDDLVFCDRVIVLVRGAVFKEFDEPPFDREQLIAATEGLSRVRRDFPMSEEPMGTQQRRQKAEIELSGSSGCRERRDAPYGQVSLRGRALSGAAVSVA